MKLDMAGIFCSCDLVLELGSYLESKYSNASSISDTLATVGYGTTYTGQPLSYNCSNWPSIDSLGWITLRRRHHEKCFLPSAQ